MRLKWTLFDKLALAAWGLLAVCAAAMSAGLLRLQTLEKVQLCLFKLATGLSCPGCGMGHALLFAFQGKWGQSFQRHPLGIPLLAVWTLWIFHGLRNSASGRPFSEGFLVGGRGRPGKQVPARVVSRAGGFLKPYGPGFGPPQ